METHTAHRTPIILIIFLFLVFANPQWGFGQTSSQIDIFLVPDNKSDLEPISKTQNGDFLNLQFQNQRLNILFQNYDVIVYEPAFPDLDCDEYLDKVFMVSILGNIDLQSFKTLPLIKHAEIIEEAELAYDLPDDYNIPVSQDEERSNDYLDLIQAPCAWELTKGDPNILVGVSDSYFTTNHEDLANKFEAILGEGHPVYNPSSLSKKDSLKYIHGTQVASLIAAETDNDKGMASIGYKTKLVGRYSFGFLSVKELVSWSLVENKNLRVINMSWVNSNFSPIRNKYYKCINEKYNIVLVAAGGNKGHCGNPKNDNSFDYYCYPASYENVISVTAVGSRYSNTSDADSLMKDLLIWNNAEYQGRHLNHMNLNDKIDIAAPGYDLYRANNENFGILEGTVDTYVERGRGTSAATPIVSGTAALMFDVNPNLTPAEVKEILKFTADRIDTIPQNTEYLPVITGLGRLNAYKAVKTAKHFDEYGFDFDSMPKKIDLMVRDNVEDIGEEPNETTDIFWNSPDIWVRNQPDGIEENENAEYDPNEENYVYVRVKNIGCDPSSADDQLKLYWTKAASSMSWPEDYMGGEYLPGNALKGDTIGTVNIPSIKPGEETILEVPWSNIPNPDDYELINDQPWHYCLLARIESEDDPMTTEETSSIRYNDEYNNNIASKNLTVINLDPGNIGEDLGGGFGFPNPLETKGHFDLELIPDTKEMGREIYKEAEVWVTLDETLIEAWEAGGKQSTDLIHQRDGAFIVNGENAAFKNLKLEVGEFGVVSLKFHFLTQKITEKQTYLYHAIQKESVSGKIMGGESYQINKSPRPLFSAITSGNKTIDKDEEVILNAELIGEPATYNWYNSEGDLIYEGVDFSTSVEVGEQYKLEVISLADGYKDYAEVELTYKPNRITSLSPNPTTGQVSVSYKINEGETAYLAVTSIENPNISDNYILDTEMAEFELNVDNLSSGVYSVALIVNGQVADTKNLIKN